MKGTVGFAVVAMVLGLTTAALAASDVAGNWQRPKGGGTAKVTLNGDKMSAKLISGKQAGFVMFKNIKSAGPNTWKGNMKHPSMPGFMTFNGTVQFKGGKLHVKGCAIGGSFCDSEVWTR